jgi:hypothetical protein
VPGYTFGSEAAFLNDLFQEIENGPPKKLMNSMNIRSKEQL